MSKQDVTQRFEVVFESDEDEGFHLYAPALKGCHSWGQDRESAREHIKEAIELWLESALERGIAVPDREEIELGAE